MTSPQDGPNRLVRALLRLKTNLFHSFSSSLSSDIPACALSAHFMPLSPPRFSAGGAAVSPAERRHRQSAPWRRRYSRKIHANGFPVFIHETHRRAIALKPCFANRNPLVRIGRITPLFAVAHIHGLFRCVDRLHWRPTSENRLSFFSFPMRSAIPSSGHRFPHIRAQPGTAGIRIIGQNQ